jgi:hypothetical protein
VPTQAEPAALLRLLDLQQEDTAIKRLQLRRDSLPEAERLAEVTAQVDELTGDAAIATKQRDELARHQDRIEGEIGIVESKIQREEQRMFSGAVSNPKELGSLQAEVEMLKRKKAQAEDSLLEVMVEREQADATLAGLGAELEQSQALARDLARQVDALLAEIDDRLTAHAGARSAMATELPDDLVAFYESIRDSKGGVGAAALERGTCLGCHTSLPSREVERLKAAGGLQRCDHCRRILVVV